jgi:hypothetical protein
MIDFRSKKVILIGLAVLTVLGAGVYYFYFRKTGTPSASTEYKLTRQGVWSNASFDCSDPSKGGFCIVPEEEGPQKCSEIAQCVGYLKGASKYWRETLPGRVQLIKECPTPNEANPGSFFAKPGSAC